MDTTDLYNEVLAMAMEPEPMHAIDLAELESISSGLQDLWTTDMGFELQQYGNRADFEEPDFEVDFIESSSGEEITEDQKRRQFYRNSMMPGSDVLRRSGFNNNQETDWDRPITPRERFEGRQQFTLGPRGNSSPQLSRELYDSDSPGSPSRPNPFRSNPTPGSQRTTTWAVPSGKPPAVFATNPDAKRGRPALGRATTENWAVPAKPDQNSAIFQTSPTMGSRVHPSQVSPNSQHKPDPRFARQGQHLGKSPITSDAGDDGLATSPQTLNSRPSPPGQRVRAQTALDQVEPNRIRDRQPATIPSRPSAPTLPSRPSTLPDAPAQPQRPTDRPAVPRTTGLRREATMTDPNAPTRPAPLERPPPLDLNTRARPGTVDGSLRIELNRPSTGSTGAIPARPHSVDDSPLDAPRKSSEYAVRCEGYITFNGKSHRYAKLMGFSLLTWRAPQDEGPPIGRIGIGFKKVRSLDEKTIFLKDTLSVIGNQMTLTFGSQTEARKWETEIQKVSDEFYAKSVAGKKLRLISGWPAYYARLWIGSWNVGNTTPDELAPWIPSDKDYDIICVGTQECRYQIPGTSSLTVNALKSSADDWFFRVTEAVGPSYVVVAKHSLWEMCNIVFVRDSLAGFVTSPEVDSVATGIANRFGNKGGVGLSFTLFDTSFCFITSHLAAHIENIMDRNNDYEKIMSDLKLSPRGIGASAYHHFTFFFGDLNYRIQAPRPEVMDLIAANDFAKLQTYDQLYKEMAGCRVLQGFTEAPCNFRPTYRFLRYETGEGSSLRLYNDEKQRVPSWCDRILWRSQPGFYLKNTSFGSCEAVASSDHCPVYASFELGVRMPPTTVATLNNYANSLIPGQAKLVFGDLAACLYPTAQSPPNLFIKFWAPFLKNSMKVGTKVVKKTDAPRWGDLSPLALIIAEKEYLQAGSIVAILLNDLPTEKQPYGYAVIPLQGACSGVPLSFKVQVEHRGKEAGVLTGTVEIQDPVSLPEKAPGRIVIF